MYLKTWIIGGSKIKQPKASGGTAPRPLAPQTPCFRYSLLNQALFPEYPIILFIL